LGVYYGIKHFLDRVADFSNNISVGLDRKTCVVQGFGNVGYHASLYLSKDAKVIAVGERDGYVYNKDGLNIDKLKKHFDTTGSIRNFAGGQTFDDSQKVLEVKCDVLVPAAKEMVITQENMKNIQAKLIGEAANGPLSFEAHQYLTEQGVIILPDMYLNAGGVVVSYFEWLKNLNHVRWGRLTRRMEGDRGMAILNVLRTVTPITHELEKLISEGATEIDFTRSGLEDSMIEALGQILKIATEKNVDLRTAAMVSSIQKVAKVWDMNSNILL